MHRRKAVEVVVVDELKISQDDYSLLRSAMASTRMEGFEVTDETERDCIRLLTGEITVADLITEIMAEP